MTNTSGQTTPFADYTGDVAIDSWHQDGRYYAVSADTTGKLFVCVPRQTITMSPSSLYYTRIYVDDGTRQGYIGFVVPDDTFSSSPPTSWSNFLTEFVNIVGDEGFSGSSSMLPIPISGYVSLGSSYIYSDRLYKHQLNVGSAALFEIVTTRSTAYTSMSTLLSDIIKIYGENYETIATGSTSGKIVYRVVVTSTSNAAYWTTDFTPHSIVGSTVSDHVTKILTGASIQVFTAMSLMPTNRGGVKGVVLLVYDVTSGTYREVQLNDDTVKSITVSRVELIAS